MTETETVCPKCSGEGVIAVLVPDDATHKQGIQGVQLVEADKLVECQCAMIKRLSYAMPAEVRMARVLPAHAAHPIVSMTNRSLFVKSTYADLLSVLKAAVYKTQGRHIRMTNDAEIRDVGVGSRSRKAKGEDARDVYNDFADLMEVPPLVVVLLNRLGHKNRAAAGYLIESLTVRIDRRKPTWVVSEYDNPFGPGSFAFSDAVWSFLHIGFEKVEIPRILKFEGADVPAPAPVAPVFDNEYVGPRKPVRRGPNPSDDDDIPDALKSIGSGSKRKKIPGRFD